jgi:DNA polymerase-1
MIIEMAGEQFDVSYTENWKEVLSALQSEKPKFFTYDTETNGLHPKAARPFLGAICYNNRVFVFPVGLIPYLPAWSKEVETVYAHNAPFDMHMTANIIGDEATLSINWADTMGLARLTFEAVSTRDGGDSLKLKMIGKKYIDRTANRYEVEVKAWLKAEDGANRRMLMALMKPYKWSLKKYDSTKKAKEELPPEIAEIEKNWMEHYPEPTYQDVPMEIMLPYVATDVIITRILVDKCLPVVNHKQQMPIWEREKELLPVVWEMEREGIPVDLDYLRACNEKLGTYITKLYNELHELTGIDNLRVGQNKVINDLLNELVDSEGKLKTDKKGLKKIEKIGDETTARIAVLVSRLRRLTKWKETYIERIIKVASHDGKFYTSLNPYNPVSGRFSGDAQQFPKDPIYTEEGYTYEKDTGKTPPEEFILYHPRKAFKGHMYYLDYSQVELRVQGHYTLYFGGDVNLCRAYMPYRCTHYVTGREYDYRTVDHRSEWSLMKDGAPTAAVHWEKLLEEGWSAWIVPETGKPWIPTDVHLATTLKALVIMGFDPDTMDAKDIKWWRSKGKTFNFMRNYGGGDAMAAETLEISLDAARAMNRGYTDAFPLVVTYQNKVVDGMRNKNYATNMYGRRYYVSNYNKHYKVANYLIQGTCADMLKQKMIDISKFLKSVGAKTKMILCVHDELQFKGAVGEEWVIAKIKEMMEDAPEILVPIVAEVEVTHTDWAAKEKVLNIA